MLKGLAIFGLLLPLATIGVLAGQDALKGTPKQEIAKPGSGHSGQQQAGTQDDSQSTAKTPTAIVEASVPVDEAAKAETRENLQIQRELALFTGLLVFVGCLQAGTMIWQAWLLRGTMRQIQTQAGHMERQTKILGDSVAAAQKSADAALKTVQVMIDSERPWLVAHFKGENESCLLENGNMRLRWEVKNVGKSPARLIEAGARLILDTIEPGWTNPSDWGHIDLLDGRILVPGDCVSFYVFWSKTENGVVRTATGKRHEDFNDLVVGYGFVRYRSAVGEGGDLTARFCECASIHEGVIDGPFTVWEFAGEEYLRCS